MIKLNVSLGERSYPIYVTTDFENLGKCLGASRIGGKIVIITDSNVDVYHARNCMELLKEQGFNVDKYVIPAGEKSKNLETVKEIYHALVSMHLTRNSTLIAVGGGVVGDITGFCAATFLRGINFVQVPTSLLAQADSSVGGKVGVDFEGSKNIIGAFYQPKLVYMNVNSLKTLPLRELKSGLAEIVKHGIIRDADFLDYIEYNADKIFKFDEDVLQYIAKVNCTIKSKVVEQDEREGDLRAILNFGHTIGHAIETISDFNLLHGECVALGMIGAFKLAELLEMVSPEESLRVENILKKIGLPVRFHELDVESVYKQMFLDKKIKNNKLHFILPRTIGDVIEIGIDDSELILTAIRSIKA